MATHSSTLAWKIPWTEEPGSKNTVLVIETILVLVEHMVCLGDRWFNINKYCQGAGGL